MFAKRGDLAVAVRVEVIKLSLEATAEFAENSLGSIETRVEKKRGPCQAEELRGLEGRGSC